MATQSPHQPSSVTVPCRCGAFHIISISQFGRPQTCKKCGSGYSVVWKKDSRTGKNAPLVVAAAKARRAKAAAKGSPESLIDLACSCGYRRKATPEEFRKGLTCPGCANPMYVDRAPRPPAPLGPPPVPYVEKTRYGSSPLIPKVKVEPSPTSRTKITARPPSGDLPKISETKRMMSGKILVICSFCGARLLVGAEHQGKKVTCMGCDKPIPVWGPPSAATPPAFRSPASPTPSGGTRLFEAKPGMPPPAFLDGPTLECPCGAVMDVRGASPGSVHTCPTCRRQVTMEKRRHPQTLTTVMLPIFSEPLPEPEPEPTVSLEPGTLEILCECGAPLLVSQRDVGHPVQCPGCSLLFEIQQHPSGLKVKPIGRIDEQDWSLQDFK